MIRITIRRGERKFVACISLELLEARMGEVRACIQDGYTVMMEDVNSNIIYFCRGTPPSAPYVG